MCLEDLRIARGKYPIKGVTQAAPTTKQLIFNANPKRTAISVILQGHVDVNAVTADHIPDLLLLFSDAVDNTIPFFAVNAYRGHGIARIEDYGQLICGAISMQYLSDSGSSQTVWISQIITDINVPVLDGQRPIKIGV